MLNAWGGKVRFHQHVLFIVTPLHVHLNCSRGLRNCLVRTRILNNVENGGQTASNSFNIRDNNRNVEQMLKQSLNAFKLIEHRFNKFQTRFQGGGKRFRHRKC